LDIVVSGRNVGVSQRVKSSIEQKVGSLDRFIAGLDSAHVVFKRERNPRINEKTHVEITVEGHGHHIRATGLGVDQMTAVEAAVTKLEVQLRKLKTRVVKRHRPNLHRSGSHHPLQRALDGPGEGGPTADASVEEVGDATGTEGEAGVDEWDEPAEPEIVRTKSIELTPMTIDDAVLRMQLLDHPFFLFCNRDTGHASVLYRRDDGDIGLIEGIGTDNV
jgi:ribosomal subunit interface protein